MQQYFCYKRISKAFLFYFREVLHFPFLTQYEMSSKCFKTIKMLKHILRTLTRKSCACSVNYLPYCSWSWSRDELLSPLISFPKSIILHFLDIPVVFQNRKSTSLFTGFRGISMGMTCFEFDRVAGCYIQITVFGCIFYGSHITSFQHLIKNQHN